MLWINYYILLSMVLLKIINGQAGANKRQRRYLLFPSSTQWGVFATVSIPLPSPESLVSVAWFFEANYYNVANASYFDPLIEDVPISRSRGERSVIDHDNNVITRAYVYTFIESMLEKHGYPGRPCLLRTICENGTSHFLHNGLLGDLLHLILTPSTSMSEENLEDSYYEAEYLGLEDACLYYNYECPSSPLEYISMHIKDFL